MINNERYKRNIALNEVGEDGQRRLFKSSVLIAGVGGGGSTVISNMASLGVGTIGLVDSDVLEISNLNRQFLYTPKDIGLPKVNVAKNWINKYNPDLDVKTYNIRLSEDNYSDIVKDYDLIIDCFDTFKSKFLLNKIALVTNKIMVFAACSGIGGRVCTVIPGKTACLRCVMPDIDENKVLIDTGNGVISPTISTVASIQSYEVAKILLGLEPSFAQTGLSFEGMEMSFRKLAFNKNPNCPLCGASP